MSEPQVLSLRQRAVKRTFDLVVATVLLVVTWPIILLAVAVATVDTRAPGLFRQSRVGRHGELFSLYKVRTMRPTAQIATTVTVRGDTRITTLGAMLRRTKIDELPQLINVLRGDMSLVGPRPDVPGFADLLVGEDRVILSVRPGITSPAALAYRDEEALLSSIDDPEGYNREVIWPDKVRINRAYLQCYRVNTDLHVLLATVLPVHSGDQFIRSTT